MILKIGEEKKRKTYEMDELGDLSERFNLRAQMLGASRLDCFVHRLDDLKPKFHTLQLALFGEAVFGSPPREVVSTGCMEKNVDKLAMEFISEAARDARDGPRGRK